MDHVTHHRRTGTGRRGRLPTGVLTLLGVLGISTLLLTAGDTNSLALAPAALLAGLLSFLSPCCLPVLSAYAAYGAQAPRERLVGTTVAFFAGLATTLILLGATATALGQLLTRQLPLLTQVGGVVIVVFGGLSLMGKGFSGFRVAHRPTAGAAGAYLYGATFALGWSACVGPILGALLTMLATQGLAVLQGAALALFYALGLGAPVIGLAAFLSKHERSPRLTRLLRGRGWSFHIGATELHLHTTSLASGLLLILIGTLLATGQLAIFSRWTVQLPLTQWVLDVESALRILVAGR